MKVQVATKKEVMKVNLTKKKDEILSKKVVNATIVKDVR